MKSIMSNFSKAISLILLGIGVQSFVFGVGVPEIDPGSAASAVALLAGAIVVIRGRRR
jgi:hypothetical protein